MSACSTFLWRLKILNPFKQCCFIICKCIQNLFLLHLTLYVSITNSTSYKCLIKRTLIQFSTVLYVTSHLITTQPGIKKFQYRWLWNRLVPVLFMFSETYNVDSFYESQDDKTLAFNTLKVASVTPNIKVNFYNFYGTMLRCY